MPRVMDGRGLRGMSDDQTDGGRGAGETERGREKEGGEGLVWRGDRRGRNGGKKRNEVMDRVEELGFGRRIGWKSEQWRVVREME